MASKPIFSLAFLFLFAAAAATVVTAAGGAGAGGHSGEPTTPCMPALQRMVPCLAFIEHAPPEHDAAHVRATVAERPSCCLMHVVNGEVDELVGGGPDFDGARAMLDVTARCLGDDAFAMIDVIRSCKGKPLPPLTLECMFTDAATSSPAVV